jgi:hypothetical protein
MPEMSRLVVVHTAEEEAIVKRDGCGIVGCPGRKK